MNTKTPKIVRVMKGLYRTGDGGVVIAKRPWTKPREWWVTWTDFFSAKHEERFFTFAEAKARVTELVNL